MHPQTGQKKRNREWDVIQHDRIDDTPTHVTHTHTLLSTETFSRLGKPAMALPNKLAECALASGVVFKDGLLINAWHELSVGLCRGNCVLYKRSLCALARVSGNAFRAGADIPTCESN